jgi:hypothetical protein
LHLHFRLWSRRLLTILAGTALLSCDASGVTAPGTPSAERYAGTFTIYSIDGRFLPLVAGTSDACSVLDLGGRISLYPDGTYAWVGHRRRTLCSSGFTEAGDEKHYGRYVLTPTSVQFTPEPAASTPSMPPFVAAFTPARRNPDGSSRMSALALTRSGHEYQLYDEDSLRPGA